MQRIPLTFHWTWKSKPWEAVGLNPPIHPMSQGIWNHQGKSYEMKQMNFYVGCKGTSPSRTRLATQRTVRVNAVSDACNVMPHICISSFIIEV